MLSTCATLSANSAKHLSAQRDRPFAALRVTSEPSWGERNPVMLSVAKHLEAQADRPFAAAQGDTVRQLRLMRIGADKSAVGTINRPLHCPYASFPTTISYTLRWVAPCHVAGDLRRESRAGSSRAVPRRTPAQPGLPGCSGRAALGSRSAPTTPGWYRRHSQRSGPPRRAPVQTAW